MDKHIISTSNAPAGSYAVIIERVEKALIARVLPVVGFAFAEERNIVSGCVTETFIIPLITDSASHPLRHLGGPHLLIDIFPKTATWKTFAPGENGLRWAERWQEETGRRIEQWDVSVWWPSKSPLFATDDETLWSDDFIPPTPAG